jgi:hypothetical protein
MRNSIAVICFILAGVCLAAGQTDKRVTDIRTEVAAINSRAAKYTKTKKDVTGISTEGAEATLFHSGNQIKKIVAHIYGETFRGVSEFYFKDGKLIFEYDRVSRYDTQIGLKRPVKIVRVEQYRSYFDDGKMFRLLAGRKTVKPGTDEFAEQERSSLDAVKTILQPAETE